MHSGGRFEGVLQSVSPGDDAGVFYRHCVSIIDLFAFHLAAISLKDAKDLSIPGAPIQPALSLPATSIRSYSPGAAAPPANKNTDGESICCDIGLGWHRGPRIQTRINN